jgi:putative protease
VLAVTRERRRPEILAPAGDRAAMEAAVRGGADAVYFGLSAFNARARATNFDPAVLGETLAYLHENGVKGYVTLNTLVFDEELPALESAVRACAEAAVDAVIVQDLGVAAMVHAIAPSMPLHASTQMTCTDAASVELARAVGASRVILARELSLEDIGAITAATDVELEVFVHGALCIAYSGQCLTSEAIGGRSANRGACAQACRLPYELVVDGEVHDLGERAYLLSPEDLEASAVVPDLVNLGIASLKIEGRLKGPAYVAATARLYREAVDAAMGAPTSTDVQALREVALSTFTRGSGPGFFRGVDHQRLVDGRTCDHRGLVAGSAQGARSLGGKRWISLQASHRVERGDGVLVEGGFGGEGEIGGRVWAIAALDGREIERAEPGSDALLWLGPERAIGEVRRGRRVFLTNDPRAQRAAMELPRARTRLDVKLVGRIGEAPVLEGHSAHGASASVVVDATLLAADRSPLDAVMLREKLDRFGDTPYALGEVSLEVDGPSRIAPSALHRARRSLVEALTRASVAAPTPHPTTNRSAASLSAAAIPPDRAPLPPGLFVLCRTIEQARAAIAAGADGVVLDFLELVGTGQAARALLAEGAHVCLTAPRIRKPGEEKIDRFLRAQRPSAMLVRSLGALADLPADDPTPAIGDFSLNVTNRLTAAEVLGRGLSAFTPSFDLDEAQLLALMRTSMGRFAEVVVHHPMPLFHMEHCVIAAALSDGKDHRTCGRPCEQHRLSLRDRAGMEHPLEADVGCRNTVFHAAAQSAAAIIPALKAAGVGRFRIELVRERPEDIASLVAGYRALIEGARAPSEVLRELRTLAGEGGYGVVRGSLRVLS